MGPATSVPCERLNPATLFIIRALRNSLKDNNKEDIDLATCSVHGRPIVPLNEVTVIFIQQRATFTGDMSIVRLSMNLMMRMIMSLLNYYVSIISNLTKWFMNMMITSRNVINNLN